jgi:hypothetical protein
MPVLPKDELLQWNYAKHAVPFVRKELLSRTKHIYYWRYIIIYNEHYNYLQITDWLQKLLNIQASIRLNWGKKR